MCVFYGSLFSCFNLTFSVQVKVLYPTNQASANSNIRLTVSGLTDIEIRMCVMFILRNEEVSSRNILVLQHSDL